MDPSVTPLIGMDDFPVDTLVALADADSDDGEDSGNAAAEEDESHRDDGEDSDNAGPESGGAKYCDLCEMWLNGPTQWEDHKIGKKHKKNLRKMGAHKTGSTAVITETTKPQPKPPSQVPKAPPWNIIFHGSSTAKTHTCMMGLTKTDTAQ